MDLSLVNSELSESRLYRTTNNLKNIDGRTIANLMYLNSLMLYMMLQDDKQQPYAKAYARQTSQYGNYKQFKTHGTDVYMLGYVLDNPESRYIDLDANRQSVRFLKGLRFNSSQHISFMKKISTASDRLNEANSFYMRLETQLKISDSRYKQFRRQIITWSSLKFSSRQAIVARITQEIRRLAKGSELLPKLTTMLKYRGFSPADDYQKPNTSFARRAGYTAAGAVAGRYAGKKIAQKTGGNVDKYKKVGTGIGAIAGFWAAGRKKQE